jgi:hypothetical protein
MSPSTLVCENRRTLKVGLGRRSGVARLTKDEDELAVDGWGRAKCYVSIMPRHERVLRTGCSHPGGWDYSVM